MIKLKSIHTLAPILFITLISGAWAILAILILCHDHQSWSYLLTLAYSLSLVMGVYGILNHRWRLLIFHFLLFSIVVVWFLNIRPSNHRNWQTDVAVLPHATIKNHLITIHNIRNFNYRSETDYTPSYYSKEFDINHLKGIDLITVYWMGPSIAHVLISFDFGMEGHLAFSIETRKEKDESYSTLRGFFRQYELYYVVADEKDVIRLRTNYRKNPQEDVYIYRINTSKENQKRFFIEYLKRVNALKNKPEWYNTLTSNCTINIWKNTFANPSHLGFNWKILVSGYLPELLYDKDLLVKNGMSFIDLRRKAFVNKRAKAADDGTDFSNLIRKE